MWSQSRLGAYFRGKRLPFFDAGDVGFDSGVGAHVYSGAAALLSSSPVSVGLGVEQGSLRAGVRGSRLMPKVVGPRL